MSVENLRSLWRDGKPVRGAWQATADSFITEILAHSGFDVLVLDMQHGMAVSLECAARWLEAVGNTDVAALVRVPWNDPFQIQSVLDAGADGVIVPLIGSVADAIQAVGACRYPPLGMRSWGPNRAHLRHGLDYQTWANEQILCLALIEHVNAVKQIDEIVGVPGLDGFFIGPNDLGLSLGLAPGQFDARHAAACRRVLDVGRSHGKVVGYYGGGGPDEARLRVTEGFNFCPIVHDVGLIQEGAARAIRDFAAS